MLKTHPNGHGGTQKTCTVTQDHAAQGMQGGHRTRESLFF